MVAIMAAMFMQLLDTTIANVALPHMQTALGANQESINWVLTSYIVMSAIAIPITGWLADRIGRRQLLLISTVAFTAASVLCAIATSLPEMVAFRIIQGITGAFIPPLVQATLYDIHPPEAFGRAMSIFGTGVVLAPIMGPVVGGWLTENLSWRWVFLINLPIGVIATLLMLRYMPRIPKVRESFDISGFLLLGLALASFQLMLDRGHTVDWFDSF